MLEAGVTTSWFEEQLPVVAEAAAPWQTNSVTLGNSVCIFRTPVIL